MGRGEASAERGLLRPLAVGYLVWHCVATVVLSAILMVTTLAYAGTLPVAGELPRMVALLGATVPAWAFVVASWVLLVLVAAAGVLFGVGALSARVRVERLGRTIVLGRVMFVLCLANLLLSLLTFSGVLVLASLVSVALTGMLALEVRRLEGSHAEARPGAGGEVVAAAGDGAVATVSDSAGGPRETPAPAASPTACSVSDAGPDSSHANSAAEDVAGSDNRDEAADDEAAGAETKPGSDGVIAESPAGAHPAGNATLSRLPKRSFVVEAVETLPEHEGDFGEGGRQRFRELSGYATIMLAWGGLRVLTGLSSLVSSGQETIGGLPAFALALLVVGSGVYLVVVGRLGKRALCGGSSLGMFLGTAGTGFVVSAGLLVAYLLLVRAGHAPVMQDVFATVLDLGCYGAGCYHAWRLGALGRAGR